MEYRDLAHELVILYRELLHNPAHQKASRLIKGELYALNILSSMEGDVHPKELSKQMSVSTARVTTILNHLEEKKLIQRRVDPNDSRQFIITPTDAGRQLLETARADFYADVRAMEERLGPEDTEAFIRIVKKFLADY